MKKVIILTLTIVSMISSNCGNSVPKKDANADLNKSGTGKAVLAFNEYQHDFGKVAEGEKIGYTFTFENKGATDLVINSASTTCGCTVPKYDSRPIAAGERGKLEVVFDTSGRDGMQTKTITVKSNASVPIVILKITAEVVNNLN